jgi:aminoglycoside phosphotransferase (APT) family kinase protein
MHVDELDIDVALARRLLTKQFPEWADLPLQRVASAGTVNALFRLGEEMVVRLPRRPWADSGVQTEQEWLPKLAPHLPLAVPVPLAKGAPDDEFPWPWSVLSWLEGEAWRADRVVDLGDAAADLASFVNALQRIDATGGPDPEPTDRGAPLADRDAEVRKAIAELGARIPTAPVTVLWEDTLESPVYMGPALWFHGDLLPGNLLVAKGRLHAVIDFGGAGVGDPACDVMPAWMLFSGESREVFRTELSVDEASWTRGRGWALSVALIALPYYWDTNPVFAEVARNAIAETLADVGYEA